MEIVGDLFSQKSSGTQHNRTAPEPSTDAMDVSFFTSMLEGPRPTSTVSAKPEESLFLTEVSKHLSNSKDGFAKIIRSTKNGVDMELLGDYPRILNNANITTHFVVKCLAKSTQCIDKLGSMTS